MHKLPSNYIFLANFWEFLTHLKKHDHIAKCKFLHYNNKPIKKRTRKKRKLRETEIRTIVEKYKNTLNQDSICEYLEKLSKVKKFKWM